MSLGLEYAAEASPEQVQLWAEQRERNREDRKQRLDRRRLLLNQNAQTAPGTYAQPRVFAVGDPSTYDPNVGLGGGLGGTSSGGGLGADSVPQLGGGAAPRSVAGETKGRKNPTTAIEASSSSTNTYLLYGAIAVAAFLLLRR